MKKNGFMLYELVISFALAFAILLIIFNTTLSLNQRLSDLYVKNKVTSQQVTFNKKIGDDFTAYNISIIKRDTTCYGNVYCYEINYKKNDTNITKYLNFSTEEDNQYIEYGESGKLERIKLDENMYIESSGTIFSDKSLTDVNPYDKILKLSIPIKYLDDEKDYGIELYYLYNNTDNPLSIS